MNWQLKKIFLFLILLVSINISAQSNYFYVDTPNGLVMRDAPNGKRIGKIQNGYKVKIDSSKKIPHTVTDNGKEIKGNWVRLEYEGLGEFEETDNGIETESIYVFDGFLKNQKSHLTDVQAQMNKYPELKKFKINSELTSIYLKGDFFGDGIQDEVFRISDEKGATILALINHKSKGYEYKKLEDLDYDFGYFEKVKAGTPLWSNYEEDFRNFEDVPKNEIVYLKHDALYVHQMESCGGGFIFWKNGEFNWLQQE